MWTMAFLQLSWFAAVSSSRTVIPDHEPTPLPEGTSVSRVTGLPVSAKSAAVQAGRPSRGGGQDERQTGGDRRGPLPVHAHAVPFPRSESRSVVIPMLCVLTGV
jgi:hypothetical protein